MNARALLPVVALLGASTVACGGVGWNTPTVFDTTANQQCAENALRRNPEPTTLPAAFARFDEGCEGGEAAACSALGVMYERGLAVDKDPRRAAVLFGRACRDGNAAGCVNLGTAYATGTAVAIDAGRAAQLFEFACDKGDPRGCTELASVYTHGYGVEQDRRRGVELYQRVCDEGHSRACYRLASLFEDGTVGPDTFTAITYYEKACIGGIMEGCDRLDIMYANKRSPQQVHPSEAACSEGEAKACNAAGLGYFAGNGVGRNLQKAVSFLEQACRGGYSASCDVIGPMLHGSCIRGDGASCTALARLSHQP